MMYVFCLSAKYKIHPPTINVTENKLINIEISINEKIYLATYWLAIYM